MSVTISEDGTVRRPAGPWTPAVHALLKHFENVGFSGAPRSLGLDGEGREVLTYIEGEVPGVTGAPPGDGVVFSVGELVRAMHDAQEGFSPPDGATWQLLPGAVPGNEVICHNDVLGHNIIVRNGQPIALIDWELAAPGRRLTDVAAAAMWWSPLRPDTNALRYGLPTNRRLERLRLLADGYGLENHERRGLLNAVRSVLDSWHEAYRVLGGVERREPWAQRWDDGQGERILAGAAWIDEHRGELDRWLL